MKTCRLSKKNLMRLTTAQQATLKSTVIRFFGNGASVTVFGSRTDDARRGGDIDIMVQPSTAVSAADLFTLKIKALAALQKELGERKIDLIVRYPGDCRTIVTQALQTGVKL